MTETLYPLHNNSPFLSPPAPGNHYPNNFKVSEMVVSRVGFRDNLRFPSPKLPRQNLDGRICKVLTDSCNYYPEIKNLPISDISRTILKQFLCLNFKKWRPISLINFSPWSSSDVLRLPVSVMPTTESGGITERPVWIRFTVWACWRSAGDSDLLDWQKWLLVKTACSYCFQ